MNRIVTLFLLALATFTLTAAGTHKFYVAIFQMDYVPEKKVIQMTSRVFIDDLESAMRAKYGKKFYIATRRETPDAAEYVEDYFAENIVITVNGTAKTIKYLGKEIEDDVLICYYTIPVNSSIKTLTIQNTTLFDAFAEQQNMIHTTINNTKKSVLLTPEEPRIEISY